MRDVKKREVSVLPGEISYEDFLEREGGISNVLLLLGSTTKRNTEG